MTDIASLRPLAAVMIPFVGIFAIIAARSRPNIREAATILTALSTLDRYRKSRSSGVERNRSRVSSGSVCPRY